MSYQADDYSRLEREIAGEHCQELLDELKLNHPALRPYASWLDVVAETQGERPEAAARDGLLRPLLATYHATEDLRIPSILMVMFWRRLRSLCRRKRRWAPKWDSEENHWANVLIAFHWTITKYNVETRPEVIESKLLGDTLKRLYREYERDWRFLDRNLLESFLSPANEDELLVHERGEQDLGVAAFEVSDSFAPHVEELRWHLEAGVIGEDVFLMLVATRVYGQRLKDYADEHGLDYTNLRQRRSRAEARIRREREG